MSQEIVLTSHWQKPSLKMSNFQVLTPQQELSGRNKSHSKNVSIYKKEQEIHYSCINAVESVLMSFGNVKVFVSNLTHNLTATLCLAFSLLGLFLIIAVEVSTSPMPETLFWRKPVVGTLFSLVCILGIFAGVFPSKCLGIFHFRKTPSTSLAVEDETIFLGHHPSCGEFEAHTFQVGEKMYCAGCTGLVVGAILSLFGVTLYFFTNLYLPPDYHFILWIGAAGVCCGLLQYHFFNWGSSQVHMIVNVFFVFGSFLLLLGVDTALESLYVDIYLIALSVFWVFTRISLSHLDHAQICSACPKRGCKHVRRKDGEPQYSRRIP